MADSRYWPRVTQRRLSRRRALAMAGAAGIGAALLAACGGSEEGGKVSSGLVIQPSDTTKDAKRGGIYKTSLTTDVGSWDPHTRGSWFGTLGALLYSRLAVVKVNGGAASTGEVVGDLAEGWEFSGDGLTATFKIRQNAKFNNVPPVNGRAVDAHDVIATWNRWRNVSATRQTIDNEVNPDAPVISMAAPDARTVTMKLAFPAVTLPSLMSGSVGQSFHILPKEAGDGYDPRRIQVGTGPWQVKEHQPSAYIHLERNPGYYDSTLAYMDGIEFPVVTEYATGLAAFKNGQVYTYPVRAEEIVTVKNEVPDLNMLQSELAIPSASMFFGYKPGAGGMFRDKRLRQAFSMSLDRDLFAEVWSNVPDFTSQGLPVEIAWSSQVECTEFTGWWTDPKSKDFGPSAKYYQHDIAEAKKLLAAAGFSNGVEYSSTYATDNYGPEYKRQVEIIEGMAAEAGFRPTAHGVLYQSDLIPNYQSVRGDFDGTGWMLRPQSSSDPVDKFAEFFFSGSGANFIGFDPAGKGDHGGDPVIDDAIRKAKIERDPQRRIDLMKQMDRHASENMYLIRPISGATGFTLAWPVMKNYLYFRGSRRSEEYRYWWIDQTEEPLNRR